MERSHVAENMKFFKHKDEPGVLCGSAWPTQLSTGHRVSSKTVEDRMSHAGRKSSTWQSSLPSLTFPLWKTLTQVYTACLFGSHSGRSTGHSLSFAICSDSLTPFGALSPLWSYNTEHNEMMQGRNTRRFKYTRTSAGKMEPHREMHIGSEQSVAGCKKACVWIRAECKAVFYAESWAETLAAKTEAPLRGRIVFFSWIQKKIKYLH